MDFYAKSSNDLMDLVKSLKKELHNPNQLWFRGQSNADYALLPSLLRHPKGFEKEQIIFQKYRQLSYKIFPKRSDDWETLFDMQHYGIPTRLLDWSETLGIAAFFAAVTNKRLNIKANAAIFILDPIELNKDSGKNSIPIIPDDKDFTYRDIYWYKKPFAPNYPIALEPLFLNDRMVAQRGMFTIHGDNLTPIEVLCDKAVKKITLAKESLSEIVEFLETMNINESTVFPDMMGVAEYIRRVYFD